jgi:hypothetical protein
MSTDFIRWKFLEFFDTEQIIEKEAHIYKYYFDTPDGFVFSLYISIFDECCIIALNRKDHGAPAIIEVALDNVIRVDCDNEKLYFYQTKTSTLRTILEEEQSLLQPSYVILVKPLVTINVDLGNSHS